MSKGSAIIAIVVAFVGGMLIGNLVGRTDGASGDEQVVEVIPGGGDGSRGANEGHGGDVKSHQCTVAVCFYGESCLVPFRISAELGVN